jgi:hypothetical protein
MADQEYIGKYQKIYDELERTFLAQVERIQVRGAFDGPMAGNAAALATILPVLERWIEHEKEKR